MADFVRIVRRAKSRHDVRVRRWRTSMSGAAWRVYHHDGRAAAAWSGVAIHAGYRSKFPSGRSSKTEGEDQKRKTRMTVRTLAI